MRRIDLNFLKDKAARRRGVGMELAVMVLLVVFAMSTLLVSTVMLEDDNLEDSKTQMTERMVLDKLGEDFCANVSDAWVPADGAYTGSVTVESGVYTMTLTRDGATMLTVELTPAGDGYTVTQWNYD